MSDYVHRRLGAWRLRQQVLMIINIAIRLNISDGTACKYVRAGRLLAQALARVARREAGEEVVDTRDG